MKREKVHLGELKLVGLSVRTSNKAEFNVQTAKIGPLIQTYFSKKVAENFKNRLTPGVTYSAYTEYESDEHGEYTYFVGECVASLENQDLSKYKTLIVSTGTFQKFTTNTGLMPQVVIKAWQDIWQMTPRDFGGKRAYKADFEIYDERASDPNQSIVDIYIGIQEETN